MLELITDLVGMKTDWHTPPSPRFVRFPSGQQQQLQNRCNDKPGSCILSDFNTVRVTDVLSNSATRRKKRKILHEDKELLCRQ